MNVEVATSSDQQRWDSFVQSMPTAEAYHVFAWRGIFQRVYGHTCHYLILSDNGAVRGVLPLVQLNSIAFGNFLVSVPGFSYAGVLAESLDARRVLVDAAWSLAEQLNAKHVELRHSEDFELGLPARTEKIAMRLKLPKTADELWSGFTSKLRAQIRRPQKAGATCKQGGTELLDPFYSVFSRNMRDLGTPVFPKALFAEILDGFPERSRLFVIEINGDPCAAGFVHGFRERLEIPSASSLREFNRESVNMLLYWSVLEYAIENGFTVFDFGRSTMSSGTYRFKKQWGAEPVALRWDYRLRDGESLPQLNPDNPKFRLATRVWQHLPLPLANWLGPKVVRGLP